MKKVSLLDTAATHTKQSIDNIKRSISCDRWQHHLESWLSSGTSLRHYCITHHLSDKQGYYWRDKLMPGLSQQQQRKAVVTPKCIPVAIKKDSEKPKQLPQTSIVYCIIDLGRGKQVRIVNAVAYNQLLERLLSHATIV